MPKTIVFDIELFQNVFLFCGRVLENRNLITIWGDEEGARESLYNVMNSGCLFVSYNGIKFDIPVITAMLVGKPQSQLKMIANSIIEHQMQPWDAERRFGLPSMKLDHIDLIEVAPSFVSLKAYGARMHMRWLKDLPFAHDAEITPEQRADVLMYCVNDLDTTEELYKRLSFQLSLRRQLGEEYGCDLRSKSDTQMAETSFVKKLNLPRKGVKVPRSVNYTAPPYLRFETPHLQALLERIQETIYPVAPSGHVTLPDFLGKDVVRLNSGTYQLGIGGIHSTHDKKVCYLSTEDYVVTDIDAASYYPSIWVLWGHVSGDFNVKLKDEYSKVYYRRLEAKAAGDKDVAEGLKVPINGSFGKLLSKYSPMYGPTLGLFITITGQLTLLMLIEQLEKVGAVALSANTDGIAIGYPRDRQKDVEATVSAFEKLTQFSFEYTPYRALALKDVNNYLAVKPDRKVKAKGIYAPLDLKKNPTAPICAHAVGQWLAKGTPFEETIRSAPFTEFISARTVNGGGVQGEEYLGKVVRWYYTTDDSYPPLTYLANGNKVPKTEGARACMILEDKVAHPSDLQYNWYVKEACRIAADIGCRDYLTEDQIAMITPPPKVRKAKAKKS